MAIHDGESCMKLLHKTTDVQMMYFTALVTINRFPSVLSEAYAKMRAGDHLPPDQYYTLEALAADAYLQWSQGLHPDSPQFEGLHPDLREALPRVFSTDLSVRPTAQELLALPCFAQYIPLVTGIVDQCRGEHLQEHEAIRAYMAQHLTADDHPVLAQQRYEAALRRQEEERLAAAYLAQQERERQLREQQALLQQQAMAAAAAAACKTPIGPPPGFNACKPAGMPLPGTPPVPAKLLHICQQRKQLQRHNLQVQLQQQRQIWQQEPLQHNWQQVKQRNRPQPNPQQTWQQKQLQETWQQQQHDYQRARFGKQRCNNKRARAQQQQHRVGQWQVTAGPVAATHQTPLTALLRNAQDKFCQGQPWQGQYHM
jgi:hypothetical protein